MVKRAFDFACKVNGHEYSPKRPLLRTNHLMLEPTWVLLWHLSTLDVNRLNLLEEFNVSMLN
jgi:hypothetical protein